jgi:hypothetical protein
MRDFCNLGFTDRSLRVLLGGAMLTVGWLHAVSGLWGPALQLFGWFPLVTGLAGWCPFYVLVGWHTRAPR